MTVRWTVRAANDRSRVARQESNPVSSSTPLETSGFKGFFFVFYNFICAHPFSNFFMKGCATIMRSKIVFREHSELFFHFKVFTNKKKSITIVL